MQCCPYFPTPASCHDALSMAEDGYWNKSLIHKMGLSRRLGRRLARGGERPEMVEQSLPAIMDHRDDG